MFCYLCGGSGQRQRVAIARALCSKPTLLLADEPTGALDQSSGTEVLRLFTKLHEMGNTIVMITHDLNVAKWAQRTVRIVDGEIFEDAGCPILFNAFFLRLRGNKPRKRVFFRSEGGTLSFRQHRTKPA